MDVTGVERGSPVQPPISPIEHRRFPTLEVYTPASLSYFLQLNPQLDRTGKLRYLLDGSQVVEFITGELMPQPCWDVLIMLPYIHNYSGWYYLDRGEAKAVEGRHRISFPYQLLNDNPYWIENSIGGIKHRFATVHPAILLAQRVARNVNLESSYRDRREMGALVRFGVYKQRYNDWQRIINDCKVTFTLKEKVNRRIEELRKWVLQQ